MLRPTPLRHVPCGFLAGFILLALLAGLACRGPAPTVSEATDRKDATALTGPTPYRAGTLEEVRLTDDFWRPRLETNRTVTIPHIFRENRETGRVANFERAAGRLAGQAEEPYEGRRFNDTDVYKAIEAASYALAESPAGDQASALRAQVDDLVRLIAAAQEPDGYLVPARTIDPEHPAAGLGPERWIHVSAGSHELYDAGHLIEAAVAHWRATGDRTLLDVAIRFADRIDAGSEATLRTASGPVRIVQRTRYPWEGTVHVELHPEEEREIVLALRIPGWARERSVPSDLYRFADAPAPAPTLTVDGQTVPLTPGRHPLASSSGGSGKSGGSGEPGGDGGDGERDGAARPAGEVVVADGFARVRRVWSPQGGAGNGVDLHLPMPARRVAANPNVTADAGRLALQQGRKFDPKTSVATPGTAS